MGSGRVGLPPHHPHFTYSNESIMDLTLIRYSVIHTRTPALSSLLTVLLYPHIHSPLPLYPTTNTTRNPLALSNRIASVPLRTHRHQIKDTQLSPRTKKVEKTPHISILSVEHLPWSSSSSRLVSSRDTVGRIARFIYLMYYQKWLTFRSVPFHTAAPHRTAPFSLPSLPFTLFPSPPLAHRPTDRARHIKYQAQAHPFYSISYWYITISLSLTIVVASFCFPDIPSGSFFFRRSRYSHTRSYRSLISSPLRPSDTRFCSLDKRRIGQLRLLPLFRHIGIESDDNTTQPTLVNYYVYLSLLPTSPTSPHPSSSLRVSLYSESPDADAERRFRSCALAPFPFPSSHPRGLPLTYMHTPLPRTHALMQTHSPKPSPARLYV